MHHRLLPVPTEPTTLPLWVTKFAVEQAIRTCAERDHKNILFWKTYDRGSHFATQTAPDLLINDIRTFFQKVCYPAGETRPS